MRFRNRSGRISWQSVKMFVLTANGQSAWDTCGQLVWKIEERWKTDFGVDIVAINYEKCWNVWWDSAADNLLEGLKLYPDGWRSAKRRAFHTIQWRSTAAASRWQLAATPG